MELLLKGLPSLLMLVAVGLCATNNSAEDVRIQNISFALAQLKMSVAKEKIASVITQESSGIRLSCTPKSFIPDKVRQVTAEIDSISEAGMPRAVAGSTKYVLMLIAYYSMYVNLTGRDYSSALPENISVTSYMTNIFAGTSFKLLIAYEDQTPTVSVSRRTPTFTLPASDLQYEKKENSMNILRERKISCNIPTGFDSQMLKLMAPSLLMDAITEKFEGFLQQLNG